MNTISGFITIILLSISATLLGQNVLLLDGKNIQSELSPSLEIYSDLSQKVTINDLITSQENYKFIPNERKFMNFGFEQDALWLKIPIQNISGSQERWFMQIKYPTLDNVNLYLVKNNHIVIEDEAGTNYNYKNKKNIYPTFDLKLEADAIYHVFIRIKSNSVKIVPISFVPQHKHNDYDLGNLFIEILLMGFIFGFGIYNVILHVLVREKMYLLIGLTFIFLFLNFFTQYGYLFLFDLGISEFFKSRMLFLSLSCSYIFFILFSIKYLNIKKLEHFWHRLVQFIFVMYIGNLLLSLLFFVPDLLINAIFMVNYLTAWIIFILVGYRAAKAGYQSARYFLASVILFFAVTIVYFLLVFGFIRFNYFLFHLTPIVACADSVLLTLGLSQVITFNNLEKRKAEELAKDNLILKNEMELRLKAENEQLINQIKLEQLYNEQSAQMEENENHFKYLTENLSDWVWQINRDRKFISNNHKIPNLLGYCAEELFNQPFMQLVKSIDYDKTDFAFTRCFSEGIEFINLPITLIAQNKKNIQIEISGEAIRDYEHKIIGILGIARDLRPKRISESLLQKAIHGAEEKERHHLSIEIHDGIGPILSGANLYLSALLSDNVSHEKQMELLQKAKQSIQDVKAELRQISNNLMPVEFVNHNLVENISLLIQNLLLTSDISCIFSTEYFNANLSNEKNIAIYRIISELLNNTIKHANAKNIRISFNNDDKIMNITYSDDGTGFDITNKSTLTKGLGMRNIQSRLKTINAKYHFKSAEGEGMSLHFLFTYNHDFDMRNN